MRSFLICMLTSGCMYYSPGMGASRAAQSTTGERWGAQAYSGVGLRTTSAARLRCGGGLGVTLDANDRGDAVAVGPEARCNLAVHDLDPDRRLAVTARVTFGWAWFEPIDGAATVRGRSAAGFAGVALEAIGDLRAAGGMGGTGPDHRPQSGELALGVIATRVDLGADHASWFGLALEATFAFDLPYYVDRIAGGS
jgi:hypothetical protein